MTSFINLCILAVTHSMNDYSLFVRQSTSSIVMLVVYVYDIILTGDDLDEISSLKLFLDQQFNIKHVGVLDHFLGIEVGYSSSGLRLHQRKFIHDLLQEFSCVEVLWISMSR